MRRIAAFFILAFAVIAWGLQPSHAQENSAPKTAEPRKPIPAYHLEFALNELEDGKKINTRQYAMDVVARREADPYYIRDLASGFKHLKIGTRVPVEAEQGKVQYLDIGTSISSRLIEDEMGLSLEAQTEVSSLVPRSPTDAYRPNISDPMIRQLSINATTAITPGKLTNLGTVDDPDSKRQFQLEVTVTKLR